MRLLILLMILGVDNTNLPLSLCREGVEQPGPDVEGRPSTASESNQSATGALSQEINSRLRLSCFGGYEGSSDELDQQSIVSYSHASICSPETLSAFSSPRSSFAREGGESHLELMALPRPPSRHHDSSPLSVLVRNFLVLSVCHTVQIDVYLLASSQCYDSLLTLLIKQIPYHFRTMSQVNEAGIWFSRKAVRMVIFMINSS